VIGGNEDVKVEVPTTTTVVNYASVPVPADKSGRKNSPVVGVMTRVTVVSGGVHLGQFVGTAAGGHVEMDHLPAAEVVVERAELVVLVDESADEVVVVSAEVVVVACADVVVSGAEVVACVVVVVVDGLT
jgi:hypothetical protein